MTKRIIIGNMKCIPKESRLKLHLPRQKWTKNETLNILIPMSFCFDWSSCSGYDIKLHLILRLQSLSLGNVEYPFITITLRSTLTMSRNTCWGYICWSNQTVHSFIQDYFWYPIDLFRVNVHTWNNLTVWKQMINSEYNY